MLGGAKWLLKKEGPLLKRLLAEHPVRAHWCTRPLSLKFELLCSPSISAMFKLCFQSFCSVSRVPNTYETVGSSELHASPNRAFSRRSCGGSNGDADS